VFAVNRWALAFNNALGDDGEEGLQYLKFFSMPLIHISSRLLGYMTAKKLEMIFKESLSTIDIKNLKEKETAEYALRFIVLLAKKKRLAHLEKIIKKIEQMVLIKKGILNLTIESSGQLDINIENELIQKIKTETGKSEIIVQKIQNSELIAGYKLNIDGFCLDASLKEQLAKMTAFLKRSPFLDGGFTNG
jgi:F0F1-type ATP synthase delta subunit